MIKLHIILNCHNAGLNQISIKSAIGFCRFDTAVSAAEKARDLDSKNAEVRMVLNNVKLVAGARTQGNKLFTAAKFYDASIAYGEGLKYDPFNSVLYCNRAACWSKLDRWSKAVDDCNAALRIRPSYTKALLRRAASYAKVNNGHGLGCLWYFKPDFTLTSFVHWRSYVQLPWCAGNRIDLNLALISLFDHLCTYSA
jgi:tetratricopeptide (TPR) repeat protein